MTDLKPDEMCFDVAPAHIAVCHPPGPEGYFRTPWCHLLKGHDGPHQCGEDKWGSAVEGESRCNT